MLHSALRAALQQELVARNVSSLVVRKPRAQEGNENVLPSYWGVKEARKFLDAAKVADLLRPFRGGGGGDLVHLVSLARRMK